MTFQIKMKSYNKELKNIYGKTLINDILYNKDVETQYFYNNILIS